MMRKKYTLFFERAKKSERTVRKILLKNCEAMRISTYFKKGLQGGFFFIFPYIIGRIYNRNDPRFARAVKELSPYLIKKEVFDKKLNEHHFYKLSEKVKKILNKETILFYPSANWYCFFYGFEDPVFYKGKTIIGEVESHEPTITLHLTDSEKRELEKEGVLFDKPW